MVYNCQQINTHFDIKYYIKSDILLYRMTQHGILNGQIYQDEEDLVKLEKQQEKIRECHRRKNLR